MPIWLVVLLAATGVGIADLLIHLYFGWRAVRLFEACPAFRTDLSQIDARSTEPFTVTTPDGLRLRGAILLPQSTQRGVVLFLPEAKGNWKTACIHAAGIVEAGFTVVAMDFRNQGESDVLSEYLPSHWASEYELVDAQAVLRFIRDQPQFHGLPIAVHGVSRGATVALALAAQEVDVQAVITQGAFTRGPLALHHARSLVRALCGPLAAIVPDWHIALTLRVTYFLSQRHRQCRDLLPDADWAQLATRPMLFFAGTADRYVPAQLVEELAVRCGHDPTVCVRLVPGAKHNQERLTHPQEFDLDVVNFLQTRLSKSVKIREQDLAGSR
ncbi:MAG: alpha/beta fold hydrolase [Planctomycetaceae bacterium]|nr:alpha/beta fold hydrolase [Planctomycetaceae bacterium]